MAPGDRVIERPRISERVHEGTWSVIEHIRPLERVLRIDRARIETFVPEKAPTTPLRRAPTHRPQDFASGATDPAALATRLKPNPRKPSTASQSPGRAPPRAHPQTSTIAQALHTPAPNGE